jgi:hypothetical protein
MAAVLVGRVSVTFSSDRRLRSTSWSKPDPTGSLSTTQRAADGPSGAYQRDERDDGQQRIRQLHDASRQQVSAHDQVVHVNSVRWYLKGG